MHRDNHRADVILVLHTGERRLQEIDLAAVQLGICPVLARNHTGIFQDVAINAQNADKGRVEGEIDTQLGHGSARQSSGIGRWREAGGAEVG